MAIQISEKNLSPLAAKALNNAKNKSQFLRDAVEFYVQRGIQTGGNHNENGIRSDLGEIKDMIRDLQQVLAQKVVFEPAVSEKAASIESSHKESDEVTNISKINDSSKENTVKIPSCYED